MSLWLQFGVLVVAIAGLYIRVGAIQRNDLRHLDEKLDSLGERIARIEGFLKLTTGG